MSEQAQNPLKLFYCYAHEDKTLRDALDDHLSSLKRQKLIEVWYDGKISAGTEWEKEIDKYLSIADIVLLLVSAAFLASDYCYSKEMERALQRHEEGTARVVPIILRPIYWKKAPFSKLQVLPSGAKPVTSWPNIDEAYEDITRKLDEAIEELQTSRITKEEWLAKGNALNELKRNEEALEAFEQAIRLDPKNALAYNGKGNTLYELERYEEVLKAYEQAIRLDPNLAFAYNNKGNALRDLKRYDEALEAYEQAIRLDPKYILAYNNKANTLGRLGRSGEAQKAWEKARELGWV